MPDILVLPITGGPGAPGRRGKRVAGSVWVRDDAFARNVLLPLAWHFTRGGYAKTHIGRKDVYLHHLVYKYYVGEVVPGLEIDHIDRDKRNNLPGNLRAVTRSVNSANHPRRRDNTSGFRGVSWNKRKSAWQAYVNKDGRRHHLGYFGSGEEGKRAAARSVNSAFRHMFPFVAVPNPTVE